MRRLLLALLMLTPALAQAQVAVEVNAPPVYVPALCASGVKVAMSSALP